MKKSIIIDGETHVPLKMFYAAIVLIVIAVGSFVTFAASINYTVSKVLTQDQFQTWVDDFREKNPASNVPRVPNRKTALRVDIAVERTRVVATKD